MFVGSFPVVSETFVVRQILELLNVGHDVDIYADCRGDPGMPAPPEVLAHGLLERTTFIDMPAETAPWEMPVWPVTGRTWPPGSASSVHNSIRVARAIPKFFRCLVRSPGLTFQTLRPAEYRYQANSLSALHRLAALSRVSGKYDVLHAHFGPVGNSFRFARELWHAPLVVSFHGYDFSTAPRNEGADVYRRLFATADGITVNSDYTRQRVEKLGCPTAKLHKLPVGLDMNTFPFHERTPKPDEPVRILTVARLTAIKGHEFVIRAMARLCGQRRLVHYDIVGDGPLRKKLERLVEESHLAAQVTFHGALNSDEVRRLMTAAHIFVLASVSVEGDQEGQGLVLQEAQASGLPVVATQHGGLPEGMLEDQSGFLVPERDVDALTERLEHLLGHPETWPAMGRAGRRFVESRYDIRKLNVLLETIYSGMIGAFGSHRAFF